MLEIRKLEPFFPNCDHCIVLAMNDAIVPCAAVLLESILETSNDHNFYDIIVLHQDITIVNQHLLDKMTEKHPNVKIRFYDMSNIVKSMHFYTENRKTITQEAYFRLFIPWIVSSAYNTALYLDTDMIVKNDIENIFHLERFSQNLICAIRDYWGICNCYIPGDNIKSYRESIGILDMDNYIISAVILFNLPAFREAYTFEQVRDIAIAKEWKQHDQDVINLLCQGRIEYISPAWGWMSDYGNNHYLPISLQEELKKAEQQLYIIHFGGGRKPWKKAYEDYDMDFWRFADHTPYMQQLLGWIRNTEYKFYIVNKLSHGQLEKRCMSNELGYFYHGIYLGCGTYSAYRIIEVCNNTLHIEGSVQYFAPLPKEDFAISICVNNERYPVAKQISENRFNKKRHEFVSRGEAFGFDFKLPEKVSEFTISLVSQCGNDVNMHMSPQFERYCPLSTAIASSYSFFEQGEWLLQSVHGKLILKKSSTKETRHKETKFCKELWGLEKKEYRKAVFVRSFVFILKRFIKKPVWLISDRVSRADDNGEAFFRFLNTHHKKEQHVFFVIKKNTPDYFRLKKIGHVIPIYSYRHKILHLIATVSISSQTDYVYRNPFRLDSYEYRDMLSKCKFVFLQHGIISTNLASWLCRARQQLAGFVTSTEREYLSILEGDYNYSEKEVWLTGMPRFDLLENHPQKCITILPTWRRYLASGQNPATGAWEVVQDFGQSTYVRFYRGLMENPKLTAKARELGYTLQIKIHPSFLFHEKAFGFSSDVKVVDPQTSYRDIYAQSDLIVTDYSSSINDFIYLKKPIFYAQFDADEFFSGNHMGTRSDFDYERDGFGEVEHDLEGTVDRIIEYMENGCQLKDKYRERIDNFFAFHDKNNCQRVYEKIKELEQ